MSSSNRKIFSLRQLSRYFVVAILSVGFTLTGIQIFPSQFLSAAEASTPVAIPAFQQAAVPTARAGNFVANAVNAVGPAVVRIDTERTVTTNFPNSPFFDDPFFNRFFGEDTFPQGPQEFQERGQGSGFIIDSNGMILTNAHVVKGADKVTVVLRDGREFQGEVRGTDEPSDLAVIKINGNNLPVAALADSETVQVGDWAIAVGNPLGLDNTVTLGIVSTLNRSSSQAGIPDKRLDFIQTDAAINPGNSGGPLLNDRGEVIGINTAIRADGQGIGFAIPINKAKEIKDQLARGENISHPYIGIRMISLNPEQARRLNTDPNSTITIPEVNGVLIMQVIPNSPAAAAGLRRADVITEINGEVINTAEQLQRTVEKSLVSQPLKVVVLRGNQTQQLSIRPGELRDANLR
ncbi:MAG: HhoA/HhoB/HtrA family serine endopeptidase [Microcoleaceae cyanobacterium]